MQKHEREALKAVRKIVTPAGLQAEFSTKGRNPQGRLVITGPGGFKRTRPVSSSPGSRESELAFKARWAREVLNLFQQEH